MEKATPMNVARCIRILERHGYTYHTNDGFRVLDPIIDASTASELAEAGASIEHQEVGFRLFEE